MLHLSYCIECNNVSLVIIIDTGSVQWTSDNVALTSPTVEECEEVMTQLKREQQIQWSITLDRSSPESLLTVLVNINECFVRTLDIKNTPLDSHCVSELANVLTNNVKMEELYLFSSSFPPKHLQAIAKPLSSNTTLKTLWIWDDDNITDKDIPHICYVISANKTLKVLSFRCRNVPKIKFEKLSKALGNNKTLNTFLINSNYLRNNNYSI